jgi:hypothetical protein
MLVDVHIGDTFGTPITLVDAAVEFRRRRRRRQKDSFEKNDQVWIACDCDQHPQLKRAFDKARANDIGVAFSNPCVEVWAYLHFSDHDKPLGRHEMQKQLSMTMPAYDRDNNKEFDYEQMKDGYHDAVRRAERMEQRRLEQRDPLGNPYTSFYKLTRLIYENGKKL